MKKTLELLRKGFESASYKTPEFMSFVRTFKSEFTKELKNAGATKIEISTGHFYVSGFFTSASGQVYYFSLSDVRGMEFVSKPALMYRTAQHYKDYTGGSNQWINIESGMSERMCLK